MARICSPIDLRKALLVDLQKESRLAPLREAVQSAADWRARLRAIRVLYKAHMECGEDFVGFDPYSLGLDTRWTPIEWRLWQDVRNLGDLRFVPQFPVGPYFLDFADPTKKIGVEADGKQYHDAAKDRARDQDLWERHGWKIYRVTGAETYRTRPDPWAFEREYRETHGVLPDQECLRSAAIEFFMRTSSGVAWAIREVAAGGYRGRWCEEMVMSLDGHRLADFPVGN